MAILGFLMSGVSDFGNRRRFLFCKCSPMRMWAFFISRVLFVVPIVLGIRGYLIFDGATGKLDEAGRALVITASSLAMVGLFSLLLYSNGLRRGLCGLEFNASHKLFIYCTWLAAPFLLVRTIYTVIASSLVNYNWTVYETWNYFYGDWRVRLVMIVLMELTVVVIFCIGGFIIDHRKVELDLDPEISESFQKDQLQSSIEEVSS